MSIDKLELVFSGWWAVVLVVSVVAVITYDTIDTVRLFRMKKKLCRSNATIEELRAGNTDLLDEVQKLNDGQIACYRQDIERIEQYYKKQLISAQDQLKSATDANRKLALNQAVQTYDAANVVKNTKLFYRFLQGKMAVNDVEESQ